MGIIKRLGTAAATALAAIIGLAVVIVVIGLVKTSGHVYKGVTFDSKYHPSDSARAQYVADFASDVGDEFMSHVSDLGVFNRGLNSFGDGACQARFEHVEIDRVTATIKQNLPEGMTDNQSSSMISAILNDSSKDLCPSF